MIHIFSSNIDEDSILRPGFFCSPRAWAFGVACASERKHAFGFDDVQQDAS